MTNEILYRIKTILLVISIIGLFFMPILNSWALLALTIVSFIRFDITKTGNFIKVNWQYFLPTIGLFFLFLTGLFYSENLNRGFGHIERSLSLLIIPLIICTINDKVYRKNLLVAVNVTFLCCSIILGLLNYIPNYFYSIEIFPITRTYAGMFFCICIIIIPSFNFSQRQNLLLYFFFTLAIVATSAKAPIFIFSVLVVYNLYIHSKMGLKTLITISLVFVFGIIMLGIIHQPTRDRFDKLLTSSDYIRKRNWSNSIQAIRDNPTFGTGLGDDLIKLNEYRQKEWLEYYENYNTHSQYLEITLKHGLVGLLLFLSFYILAIGRAYKDKNITYVIFILVILAEYVIEVYLARQQGIVPYALYMSLLIPFNKIGYGK